ncbi:MAG: metal-dependent transcriptional regulator [Oligosphaeraceae bacterium]|nr:metal-dependent transcriptional regulator [Oligosphaeraceae bacterium]
MRDMEISSSLEDYLEAIAEIIQDNEFAHTKDIAERLRVSMPSVSNALQALSLRHLIRYQPHVPVSLTRKGLELANVIRHRHQVMKCFFADILKLTDPEADAAACKIEHVLTEKSMARFLALSEAISTRQDCRQLREFLAEQMPAIGSQQELVSLDQLLLGEEAEVISLPENQPEQQKCTELGLLPGTTVRCEGREPFNNELLLFRIQDRCLALRKSEACHIQVRVY